MESVTVSKYVTRPFKMAIPTPDDSYPGANVQESLRKHNYWAPAETKIITRVLNSCSGGTVLDIGANTGYFSFIALTYPVTVIAVEPNTIHSKYIYETLSLNNFTGKLNLIQAFASDRTENVLFDGWSGYSSIMNKSDDVTYSVPTVRLESLIPNGAVFVKIDVEGAEPEVIRSLGTHVKDGSIPYIMFEFTYITNDCVDQNQVEMVNNLVSHGYTLYNIECHGHRDMLVKINDLNKTIAQFEYEYIHIHKKYNPVITSAGTNMLAIHNSVSHELFPKGGCEL